MRVFLPNTNPQEQFANLYIKPSFRLHMRETQSMGSKTRLCHDWSRLLHVLKETKNMKRMSTFDTDRRNAQRSNRKLRTGGIRKQKFENFVLPYNLNFMAIAIFAVLIPPWAPWHSCAICNTRFNTCWNIASSMKPLTSNYASNQLAPIVSNILHWNVIHCFRVFFCEISLHVNIERIYPPKHTTICNFTAPPTLTHKDTWSSKKAAEKADIHTNCGTNVS